MGSKREEGERAASGRGVVVVRGEVLLFHRLGMGEKLAAWRSMGAIRRDECE
jgi:hypothetical protein